MRKLEGLNNLLHRFNFELTKYNKGTNVLLRRKAILEKYNIDLIIDVGANTGVFGKQIRQLGYNAHIVSFEPLRSAFKMLAKKIGGDKKWKAFNFALGAENCIQQINISANSHSSSFLKILDSHTKAEASASYIGTQEIEIKTLDSVFSQIGSNAHEFYLKIDTQGFELNVLKGAANSLNFINTIQLEMSLEPLYEGQPLYNELLGFLHNNNYKLIDIEPGFADLKTGTLLQFDGTFRRSS